MCVFAFLVIAKQIFIFSEGNLSTEVFCVVAHCTHQKVSMIIWPLDLAWVSSLIKVIFLSGHFITLHLKFVSNQSLFLQFCLVPLEATKSFGYNKIQNLRY